MRFLNNLYTINRKNVDAQNHQYEIKLDPNHMIFQAHFPNEPITPGVCIIQIAKELLEEIVQVPLMIHGVKNVKFLNVISPLTTPIVIYEFEKIVGNDEENEYRAQVLVMSTDVSLAKLSFICKKLC